jgi:hypothetical protein
MGKKERENGNKKIEKIRDERERERNLRRKSEREKERATE